MARFLTGIKIHANFSTLRTMQNTCQIYRCGRKRHACKNHANATHVAKDKNLHDGFCQICVLPASYYKAAYTRLRFGVAYVATILNKHKQIHIKKYAYKAMRFGRYV